MQPTDYGLGQILTSPLVLAGLALILGGSGALVWMFRGQLGYYEPEIPPVVQPPVEQTYIHPAQPVAPNYHRSGEYPLVARIPGATPQAGPVCPFCGAPFHPVCPSAPKERTDETAEIRAETEPEPSPVKAPDLAPQFVALDRFFNTVDTTAAVTNEQLGRIVDTLAGRTDDCPLTTGEIPVPAEAPTPFYDAAIRNTDTRELSEVMKKVRQA